MDDIRLFFLFNNISEVRAYHAEVPNLDDDHVSMQIHGPHSLGERYNYGEPVSKHAADPVFDSNKLQVLYATNGRHNDSGAKDGELQNRSAIDVWTIGRHVSREKVERTGLRGISLKARPSVVTEGDIISASVPEYYPRDSRYCDIAIRQRQDNGQWAVAEFKDDSGGMKGGAAKLFAGTLPKIEYTYHLAPQDPEDGGWFYLNTMRSSNFRQLSKDRGLTWQTSSAYFAFDLPGLPAHVFAENSTNNTSRLLFFAFDRDCTSIKVASIKLRADGSLEERNGDEVKVASQWISIDKPEPGFDDDEAEEHPGPRIGSPSTSLNAFVFGKELLLMWATDEGLGGVMGELEDDGTVPDDWEWSTVTIQFDNAFKATTWEYSFNGVQVSSQFVS